MREFGLILITIGSILVVVGLMVWLGKGLHLPGDIVFKKENTTFFFPIGTCILISIVLSLLFYFFRR